MTHQTVEGAAAVPRFNTREKFLPDRVRRASDRANLFNPKATEVFSMNDQAIENEIQTKGLNAPRVTPARIEAVIVGEYFFTAADATRDCPQFDALKLLTFCVLVLKNGFTVTGESACASPDNFDAELGRKIARANAVNKIWPLEGYLLKQRLFDEALATEQPNLADLA